MVKGICPKCNSLILIDEKANTTKCPSCNNDIFTMSAIKNFNRAISMYKRKGEIAFYGSTNYTEAYKAYEALNKLKDDNLVILGLLVRAKLYTSNLKKIHIKEATDLLLKLSDKVEINPDNISILDEYLISYKKDSRLIVDKLKEHAHISSFAFNNYLNALEEYKYYLEAYKNIYNSLSTLNKYFKEPLEVIDDEIKYCIDESKKEIKVDNENSIEHDFYNDKKKVCNDIFPNYSKLYKFRMVLYGITGLGLVLSIVGLSILNTAIIAGVKFSILGVGLLFFIGGYFLNHHLRSKQYHLNY